ncbi:MAG: LLM class flavin-dependent oxidoreductase, partial [Rhodoglobus sp.]
MRIAYSVGYWKHGPPPGALKAIRTAELLGFESVWTAEAYGSDAFTPLAWWGSRTRSIKLGTGIA